VLNGTLIEDGNEFYQEMTDKEVIHQLEMDMINYREAEKMLRENIKIQSGCPLLDNQKLSVSSQVIKVPNILYQLN